LFQFQTIPNHFTCLHKFVEEVESKGKKCNVSSFVEINGGAGGVENAYTREKSICPFAAPFVWGVAAAHLVLDAHSRLRWCCA
jgi:hypothetical protein